MCAIERSYHKVVVGQLLKRYLEYVSSYKHFSKMTKYDLTLTQAEGQTEKGVCAIERSNPKAGVGQILKLYLKYFSSYKHFSKLERKT